MALFSVVCKLPESIDYRTSLTSAHFFPWKLKNWRKIREKCIYVENLKLGCFWDFLPRIDGPFINAQWVHYHGIKFIKLNGAAFLAEVHSRVWLGKSGPLFGRFHEVAKIGFSFTRQTLCQKTNDVTAMICIQMTLRNSIKVG